ncbi:glycine betaine/proline transport system permease protein [Roseovarius nanhaiticus]|uniref:Glycine betaine/proline transport system permease protein n=1 Tax=Roseovarius nanhaiticus TaxID=573024 RepID=A0A1N7F375_9RHOB|nr:ABC transporter permease subunit [Roseovarius nanhaiticus]SEK62473.1 glycine betaine/proline transport system permease protein [Roseovarius nanhaiticus]SIR94798.1 glycine betaine/proline transport system permease protein [Roseovarius nanhaiticus]
MTTLTHNRPLGKIGIGPKSGLIWAALLFNVALLMTGDAFAWMRDYPETWVLGIAGATTTAVKYLVNDMAIGSVTIAEMTRGFANLIKAPMELLQGVLSEGFEFYGDDGSVAVYRGLPWPAVIIGLTAFSWWTAGRNVAIFSFFSLVYFLVFGLWGSSMLTLSSVVVAVFVSFVLGILLGVLGHRNATANAILMPVYDVMQTIPTFSYLVPVLLLFGFNPVAAMIATVIYAMPPMARVTTLALQRVPPNISDFGDMAGCTRRQQMWQVLLPAARQNLLIGLNQVIMLTFAMVIIASVIGAGGLGGEVFQGLKALKIGNAVEAGIAITLMAIMLDRISRAIALSRPDHVEAVQKPLWQRHPLILGWIGFTLLFILLGQVFPALYAYPKSATISTGSFWNDAITWIGDTYYSQIKTLRDTTITYVMRPTKSFLLDVPWLGFIAVIAAVSYAIGGMRLSIMSACLLGFIAVTGYWDGAMVSLYLVLLAVIVTLIVALPVGIWAGLSPRADQVITPVIDTLQTLPSFVYLIPVVMLFSVGEFAGLVAIVAYSLPPGVRYTKQGIQNVASSSLEAGEMAGCTRWQKLTNVQLPMAIPDIMLGINQTIMFAFGMLVITSLVGTRGLEHDTLVAISKVQPGEGIVAGLGIAFLAIIADRLISQGSRNFQRRSGLGPQ